MLFFALCVSLCVLHNIFGTQSAGICAAPHQYARIIAIQLQPSRVRTVHQFCQRTNIWNMHIRTSTRESHTNTLGAIKMHCKKKPPGTTDGYVYRMCFMYILYMLCIDPPVYMHFQLAQLHTAALRVSSRQVCDSVQSLTGWRGWWSRRGTSLWSLYMVGIYVRECIIGHRTNASAFAMIDRPGKWLWMCCSVIIHLYCGVHCNAV